MITADKYFELITAALQRLTIPGSDVTWNSKIGSRQFDVLVRAEAGLHSLLLAYEVKHKSRPTSVEALDAFVTKAKDAGVDKAIFVSTSGFQAGAVAVAKRHNVDLFSLTLVPGKPGLGPNSSYLVISRFGPPPIERPEVHVVATDQAFNNVTVLKIHYADGRVVQLPSEPTQMEFCLRNTRIGKTSLEALINTEANRRVPTGQVETRTVGVRGEVIPADEFFISRGIAEKLSFEVEGVVGDILSGNARIDTSVIQANVIYENIFTGVKAEFPVSSLPVGNPYFEVGRYYFTYDPLRYYYCDKIVGDSATIFLVESFQLGTMFAAVFTVDVQFSPFYIPLDDKVVIARLARRVQRMKSQKVMQA